MHGELLKDDVSSVFQTFGIGSIAILSTAWFGRYELIEWLGGEDVQTSQFSDLQLLLIPMIIFAAYTVGLALMGFGSIMFGDDRDVIGRPEELEATCLRRDNSKLWLAYQAMLKRASLFYGLSALMAWLALLVVAGIVSDWYWGIGFSFPLMIVFVVLVGASFAAGLTARKVRLSFAAILDRLESRQA